MNLYYNGIGFKEDKFMLVWDWKEERKIYHGLAIKFRINTVKFCNDGVTITAGTNNGMKLFKADGDSSNVVPTSLSSGDDNTKLGGIAERIEASLRLKCYKSLAIDGVFSNTENIIDVCTGKGDGLTFNEVIYGLTDSGIIVVWSLTGKPKPKPKPITF